MQADMRNETKHKVATLCGSLLGVTENSRVKSKGFERISDTN